MFSRFVKVLYRRSALWFWLWAVIIFILCATPGQYIPSNNWLDLLSVDKLVHASIFCVLSLLGLFWLHARSLVVSRKYWCVAACALYGLSLEIMQATVFSHRSADYKDAIANATGCFVAVWVFALLEKKKLISL